MGTDGNDQIRLSKFWGCHENLLAVNPLQKTRVRKIRQKNTDSRVDPVRIKTGRKSDTSRDSGSVEEFPAARSRGHPDFGSPLAFPEGLWGPDGNVHIRVPKFWGCHENLLAVIPLQISGSRKIRQKNTSSWGDPVRFAIQAAQRLINTLETAETDGLSSVKAVSSVLIRQNFSKSRSHNTKNSRESPL